MCVRYRIFRRRESIVLSNHVYIIIHKNYLHRLIVLHYCCTHVDESRCCNLPHQRRWACHSDRVRGPIEWTTTHKRTASGVLSSFCTKYSSLLHACR